MYVTKSFVFAAILSLGAASFAQDGLSREQVRSEMVRAQAAGEVDSRGEAWDGTFQTAGKSGVYGRPFAEKLSREAVIEEMRRARSSGEMERNEGSADYVGGD